MEKSCERIFLKPYFKIAPFSASAEVGLKLHPHMLYHVSQPVLDLKEFLS